MATSLTNIILYCIFYLLCTPPPLHNSPHLIHSGSFCQDRLPSPLLLPRTIETTGMNRGTGVSLATKLSLYVLTYSTICIYMQVLLYNYGSALDMYMNMTKKKVEKGEMEPPHVYNISNALGQSLCLRIYRLCFTGRKREKS